MPGKEKKNYIIDTSVITASPYSLFTFDEHEVTIPRCELSRLEEAAALKGEKGRNAQNALRIISSLCRKPGALNEGAVLPSGGKLLIGPEVMGEDGRPTDDLIAHVAYLKKCLISDGREVILVSSDPLTRVRACLVGYACEEYRTGRVEREYPGRIKISCDYDLVRKLKKFQTVAPTIEGEALIRGQYITFQSPFDSALGCFTGEKFAPLRHGMRPHGLPFCPYGVTPRNDGQIFAVDAMMAPAAEVPLVILKGPAGTAKTFLALACGLEQVVGDSAKGDKPYDRILVARPNIKFDEDIGFLKGSEEDKIGPLIRPIWDNLEQLTRFRGEKDERKSGSYAQYLFDSGHIVAQALAYMRGRSITNTWVIIDEAQNMTPLQAFGIISRVGTGTKIILAGDPEQVDAPHLDRWNNGLSFASERMAGSALCRQVTFEQNECERSPLAMEAIKRLSLKGQG